VNVDIAMRSGLVEIAGAVPTFASAGLEERATAVAGIAGSSRDYLAGLLDHRPEMKVLVLSEADWVEKGRVPLFGLPNAEQGTLVVAGTEAAWWSDLVLMVGDDRQAELATVYGGSGGSSMPSASPAAPIAIPRHSTSPSTTPRLLPGYRRRSTRCSAPSRWRSE
jgi:hypothetical protein